MKKFLPFFVLLLASCSDVPSDKIKDSTAVDSVAVMTDTTLRHPASTVLDSIQSKPADMMARMDPKAIEDAISKNTPEGWVVLDTMTGDLNRDQFLDMLIVLKSTSEDTSMDYDMSRPLLILTGNPSGGLTLVERNDHVVMCKNCGGIWGDPYDGLAIKNGYFSVEHYGGSSERWTQIITFKYHEKEKAWFLHRDAGVMYSVFDPEMKEEEQIWHKDDYGTLNFTEYMYN